MNLPAHARTLAPCDNTSQILLGFQMASDISNNSFWAAVLASLGSPGPFSFSGSPLPSSGIG